MTEGRWLTGLDPYLMLRFMLGKTGDRKLRLFGCACVRRVWPLVTQPRCQDAVEVAERYADRLAGPEDLRRARGQARAAAGIGRQHPRRADAGPEVAPARHAAWAAAATVQDTAWDVACDAAWSSMHASDFSERTEREAQCELIRDTFGNPFRPVTLDPAWLRWNDGCVPKMARAIYDTRAFGDLPILADALEEAGCDRPDVLAHCRQSGGHARGCWVVDLVRSGAPLA